MRTTRCHFEIGTFALFASLTISTAVRADSFAHPVPRATSSTDGAWMPMTPYGIEGVAAYDSSSDRVLLATFGRIWAWDASTLNSCALLHCTAVSGGGTPAYDPNHNRLIYVQTGDDSTRVWQITLGGTPTAARIPTTGFGPPSYSGSFLGGYSVVYDSANDRVLVFGGAQPCGCYPTFTFFYNTTWALDLSGGTGTWSELSVAGSKPAARQGHSAIYDPVNHRMLVFGGTDANYVPMNDVNSLSLLSPPTWHLITTGASKPPARSARAMFRPSQGTLVIANGEVWELLNVTSTSGNWIQHSATDGSADVLDTRRDRLVDFYTPLGGASSYGVSSFDLVTNVPSAHFRQISPTVMNSGEYEMFHDAESGNIFDLSLSDVTIRRPGELWSLSPLGSWTRLAPAGTWPSRRTGSTMILDSSRHRILAFGGYDSIGVRSDLWALGLEGDGSWSQLPTPTGTPPRGGTGIYDPRDDRMIVVQDLVQNNMLTLDVWSLSLSPELTWTHLQPTGSSPPPRPFSLGSYRIVYDPPRHRVLALAGDGGYALTLSPDQVWSNLQSSLPAQGWFAYDPVADRFLMGASSTVWEMAFPDPPVWRQLNLADGPGNISKSLFFDPVRDRLVSADYTLPNWLITFGSRVDAPPAPGVARVLPRSLPNPAVTDPTIQFAVSTAGHVVLTIFDLTGRRVRRLIDADLPAGPGSIVWDRRNDAGDPVAAGVYVCFLRVGSTRQMRRLVVVR